MSEAGLSVAAVVASRGVDVEFTVAPGEVLAIVGPNGAGKSTVAAVIAGLLDADSAVIRIGDRTLTDTARGVHVRAHARGVGLLLQDPLVFPHMSVRGNVEFAARRRRATPGLRGGARTRRDARAAAAAWLSRVGVPELAGHKPGRLSGGQAQRVALARALAAEPDVMLLDEPLAGLDVAAAAEMRMLLRNLAAAGAARTMLVITHDLLDVLTLADRVLVLEGGTISELGPTTAVLTAPRSRFGARFAGVNLVRGVLCAPATVRGPTAVWRGVAAEELAAGQQAVAVFTPAAVAVYRTQPHGSPRNSVEVRICGLEAIGSAVRIHTDEQADGATGLAADVTAEAVAELGLAVGDQVWFTVKAQEVGVHAAARAPGVSP